MRGDHLIPTATGTPEANVYADKASVVLEWLLRRGVDRKTFGVREAMRATGISIGLVQRVFAYLVKQGVLHTQGVRTAKRFFLAHPQRLLEEWSAHYSIVKKCRMWTYRTSLHTREALLEILKQPKWRKTTTLALHSAAAADGFIYSNLPTLELYLTDPDTRPLLEEALHLEPQERGYEVLLLEPYYKRLLHQSHLVNELRSPPLLLTYLDLYHFPLRGREGAEFISQRADLFKRIR